VILGVFLVAGACSGGGSPEPAATTEEISDRAFEFALSARRALEGTRYEGLGDEWLAGVVEDACGAMEGGASPDAVIGDAIDAAAGSGGDPVDEEILAEVLTAGTAQVCPDAVLYAASLGDPGDGFLAVVRTEVRAAGLDLDDAALLGAGDEACRSLDAGSGVETAAVAVLEALFGGEAGALVEPGAAVGAEVIAATTVLVSAAVYLCPEHRDLVAEYSQGSEA